MRKGGLWSSGGSLIVACVLAACGGDAQLGSGGGGFSPPGDDDDDGGAGEQNVRIGTRTDAGFTEGALRVSLSPLAAGGTSELSVDLVDDQGTPAAIDATATFTSNCISDGLATVEPQPAEAVNGRIRTSYRAQGCNGTDEITAQVEVEGEVLTASGSIVVQPAALGGAEFVSASRNVIGLLGSSIPQSASLTFRVLNSAAAPAAQRDVTFEVDTNLGDLKLSSDSGRTDSDGLVQTSLTAGSLPTTVRVRMNVVDPVSGTEFSTQSELLTITTGLPTSRRVSLSAARLNIPGLTCDGEPSAMSFRMADRYGNPVPEGTAVVFGSSLGGQIVGQCVAGDPLGDPTTESGVCSVLFTAQGTRPDNGRVRIVARQGGELAFDDANGNGFFEPDENFDIVPEPYFDVASDGSEPPTNENGTWDRGEEFFDTNENGAHDTDPTNGQFVGYTCDEPGVNCSSNTLQIWESLTLVLSGTTPVYASRVILPQDRFPEDCGVAEVCVGAPSAFDPGTATITLDQANQSISVRVRIRDVNNNPLPVDTDVSLASEIGAVRDPATQQVGNTNARGGSVFFFSIAGPDDDEGDSGVVQISTSTQESDCGGSQTISSTLFNIRYEPSASVDD